MKSTVQPTIAKEILGINTEINQHATVRSITLIGEWASNQIKIESFKVFNTSWSSPSLEMLETDKKIIIKEIVEFAGMMSKVEAIINNFESYFN